MIDLKSTENQSELDVIDEQIEEALKTLEAAGEQFAKIQTRVYDLKKEHEKLIESQIQIASLERTARENREKLHLNECTSDKLKLISSELIEALSCFKYLSQDHGVHLDKEEYNKCHRRMDTSLYRIAAAAYNIREYLPKIKLDA